MTEITETESVTESIATAQERRVSDLGPARFFCDVWDVDLTDDHQADFATALESAKYLDPREERTGTLADKASVVLITHQRLALADAELLAAALADAEDPRVSDPHGPAGAIPVSVENLHGAMVDAWVFFGWAVK